MRGCKTLGKLQDVCHKIMENLYALATDSISVNIKKNTLEVDENALDLYPDDVPNTRTLYPSNTIADVNCLPSLLSEKQITSMR